MLKMHGTSVGWHEKTFGLVQAATPNAMIFTRLQTPYHFTSPQMSRPAAYTWENKCLQRVSESNNVYTAHQSMM